MPDIQFTQYLLPNGKRKLTSIERPQNVWEEAEEILKAGYRFECEMLTTGHVSLTIAGKNTDVEIEICRNDAEVPKAVDRIITRFDFNQAAKREKEAVRS